MPLPSPGTATVTTALTVSGWRIAATTSMIGTRQGTAARNARSGWSVISDRNFPLATRTPTEVTATKPGGLSCNREDCREAAGVEVLPRSRTGIH